MKRILFIAVGVVLIAVVGIGIYMKTRGPDAPPVFAPLGGSTETPDAGPRTPPAGHQEYRNDRYHFSLFYPEAISPTEYQEKGNAFTVTFEGEGDAHFFQVFILPYKESQITPARLKRDIPTGVVREQTPIVIDGASATMFYSTNAILGDTREVWFIRDGYLYEVTTTREQDAWLSTVMATWKFI
ncbi:MAG TPA: hypothetical protein VFY28_03295 [Candidatus Paceibacterota bacterium]|nr:hypothetical protein [Candidatus Paceibacterota bacterium]